MKFLLQILFLFLTWFINLGETPVFSKVVLPSYEHIVSKTENEKEESTVKIGEQNFARSGIENEIQFSNISKVKIWASIAFSEKEVNVLNGAGNMAQSLTGALKSTYDDIISFGGSAIENNGILKLLNKNGIEVAQISNGKILPTKYFDDLAHSGATPIGQTANGYQVFKKGDDLVVKRMPDKSAYSANELTELTQYPDAHVLERHGHDVTDEALIKRANSGIAPDGSFSGSVSNPYKPPHSSKFESSAKVKDALDNTRPGTTAFANGTQQGSTRIVTCTSTSGNFGKGVPKDGNTFIQMNEVKAIYKDVGGGNYQLLTMYPEL
jgi:hypothetical protein